MRFFLIAAALLFLQLPALSEDIFVPEDYDTIQGAIDAATSGDRILVAPGTYFEHLDYLGKAVELKSQAGPELTVIDANKSGRGVTFQSGETRASVLDGFTITNGDVGVSNGGGIDCTLESSPTIQNCVISYNKADALGGGIACRGVSCPKIHNCVFIGNVARDYYEGSSGGGICCFILSDAIISDCVFIDNESESGGGIQCSVSFPVITNCVFKGNVADKFGGAIDCGASDPIITNCTMLDNDAALGGALSLTGIFLPSYPVLTNCILWDNDPGEVEVRIGEPTITYSNVQGGWPGAGNIDELPLLAGTPVDNSGFDFHLFYHSPCRDAGTESAPGLPAVDYEGDPRVAYGAPDMGADEFHPHLYCTGEFIPDGFVLGKFAGLPDTWPVGLFIGSGLLDPPMHHAWGEFHLASPWVLIPLVSIPSNGLLEIPASLPSTPGPYDIPMQALFGQQFSNLFVLKVR